MSANILNLKKSVVIDDSITGIQYHSYNPYTNSFNNNDEIRIAIQQQDIYILPCESYIYIEGTFTRRETVDAANAAPALPNLVNNGALFLFDEIRYELNGFEIDRCKNVGITSTMKGYVSHIPNDYRLKLTSWNNADTPLTTNFNYCIPLNTILGFAEDYRSIIMNAKHELIITRSRNDMNVFVGDNDVADVNILKIQWRIPHIHVNDSEKLTLLKHIEKKQSILLGYRSWELYEYPTLPQTNKHIWSVKTSSQINKPRYLILGFQTNRNNVITSNTSQFDHCNITDVKVYLNSECYPYESLNVNFRRDQYALLYKMYADFQNSYYHGDREKNFPLLNLTEFKTIAPLIVIDCSRQNENLKKAIVDIRIEMQFSENIPAQTAAYCLIIHDNLITYNPYTNIVNKSI